MFAPNAPTNSTAQAWIYQAEHNYSSVDPNNFEIVTNTGTLALTGQVQEFIVPTPEPGTIFLLGGGLLVVLWTGMRGRKSPSGISS